MIDQGFTKEEAEKVRTQLLEVGAHKVTLCHAGDVFEPWSVLVWYEGYPYADTVSGDVSLQRILFKVLGETAPVYWNKRMNAGQWQHFLEAGYSSKPTEEDVLKFSKHLGFGNIMNREGGYILSKVEITEHDKPWEGKWIARWSAILD